MARPRRAPSLRQWMAPAIPGSRLLGWLGPLLVTLFAGVLRFYHLGRPNAIIFDETYYAKDAYALLKFGYEHNTAKNADQLLLAHNTNIWSDGGSFIAHPPAGKWVIAIGYAVPEWISHHIMHKAFYPTPLEWRFMGALLGTIAVLMMCRIARRMTGSTLLGCAAGLLLALDGLELVTSRTAILDIFVMFWILAAFACVLKDRDATRAAMARKAGDTGPFGPFVMHWWLIPAGLCLGTAIATKWTGVFYVVAFGLLAVVWSVGARRTASVRDPYGGAVAMDAGPAFLALVVLPVITYVAWWSGWIFTSGGWGRGHASSNPITAVFQAMPKLWSYHKEMFHFHTTLDAKHPYQSWPWNWMFLKRPVSFYYVEPKNCGASKCSSEVLGIGTPAIWWVSIATLLVVLGWWLVHRDWRSGVTLLGFAAGWLPWFYYGFNHRTMFLFYATPMLPFMVLSIVLVIGLVIGPANAVPGRRVFGAAASGAYLLIVIANLYFLYPVLTGHVMPYDDWHARMWLNSWI